MRIRIGHSPDPDDAFMAWGIASGRTQEAGLAVELVPRDIQSLNERALSKDPLEATAMSLAAFARVSDRYHLLTHGASFADGEGPVLVSRSPLSIDGLAGATLAVPGELTTAFAALKLALGDFDYDALPFEKIPSAVLAGDYDAGLLIHEAQLTYAHAGLVKVLDLAEWWAAKTHLPLPLGVVAVRRDLGEAAPRVSRLLRASTEAALKDRANALEYAHGFAHGGSLADTDRFVSMYVGAMALDMGERGKTAITEFLAQGAAARVLRVAAPPSFLG